MLHTRHGKHLRECTVTVAQTDSLVVSGTLPVYDGISLVVKLVKFCNPAHSIICNGIQNQFVVMNHKGINDSRIVNR